MRKLCLEITLSDNSVLRYNLDENSSIHNMFAYNISCRCIRIASIQNEIKTPLFDKVQFTKQSMWNSVQT